MSKAPPRDALLDDTVTEVRLTPLLLADPPYEKHAAPP